MSATSVRRFDRGLWCRCAIAALALVGGLAVARPAAGQSMRVNEVSFVPPVGTPQWVELYNAAGDPVSVAAWVVTDYDGVDYTVPDDLPAVPPGGFVVLYFDGAGAIANEVDFGDGVVHLHTEAGLVDPLDPRTDQLALYRSPASSAETIRSFVAWGESPGAAAADAVAAGLWPGDQDVISVEVSDAVTEGASFVLSDGGTAGVFSDAAVVTPASWVAYAAEAATPGAANPLPGPGVYLPPDGIQQAEREGFSFSWIPVAGTSIYEFQLDDDPAFGSPEVDEFLAEPAFSPSSPLPLGERRWRVRAVRDADGFGIAWSGPRRIVIGFGGNPPGVPPAPPGGPAGHTVSGTVADAVSGNALADATVALDGRSVVTSADGTWVLRDVPSGTYQLTATRAHYAAVAWSLAITADTAGVDVQLTGDSNVRGVGALAARKDGRLLCLDGCDPTGANDYAWDASHVARRHWGAHEQKYCTPTAATMLARYRGGSVTIEEVSYDLWRGGGPEGDLGHQRGHDRPQGAQSLRFALNATDAQLHLATTRPTDAELVAFIDADRPVRYSTGGHAMVVDGYRWVDGRLQARFLNTDNDGAVEWWFWRDAGAPTFLYAWIPDAGLTGRNSDPLVSRDTDGDGVMDFDETHRFQSRVTDVDSDRDEVPDKQEIFSYTFHHAQHAVHADRTPASLYDVDRDGAYAEADCDTDTPRVAPPGTLDGEFDGGEDVNGNGIDPEAGETDVFDPRSSELALRTTKGAYAVGEDVILDPRSGTLHGGSAYDVEVGSGCPTRDDGTPLANTGTLHTDAAGRVGAGTTAMRCTERGLFHLTVDVLRDGIFHAPSCTDPQVCWFCGDPLLVLRDAVVQTFSIVLVDSDHNGIVEFPEGKTVFPGELRFPDDVPIEFRGKTLAEAPRITAGRNARLLGRADRLRSLGLVALQDGLTSAATVDVEALDDVTVRARAGSISIDGDVRLAAGDQMLIDGRAGDVRIATTGCDPTGPLHLRAANRLAVRARGADGRIDLIGARLGARQVTVDAHANVSRIGAKGVGIADCAVLTTDPARTGVATAGDVTVASTGRVEVLRRSELDSGRNLQVATYRTGDDLCMAELSVVEAAATGGTAGRVDLRRVRGRTRDDGTTVFTGTVAGTVETGVCVPLATVTTTTVSPGSTTTVTSPSTTTTLPGVTDARWRLYVRVRRTTGSEINVDVPLRASDAPLSVSIDTALIGAFRLGDRMTADEIVAVNPATLDRFTAAASSYIAGRPGDYPGVQEVVALRWAARQD